jgi:hypothetical protein
MRWLEYLAEQRALKLRQIERLETGDTELSAATGGVTSDITAEELTRLKSEVAQIRQVFIDEGIQPED